MMINQTSAAHSLIVDQLYLLKDRTEGIDLLKKLCPTKNELVQLAKFMGVGTSGDSINKLRERVVEHTVGHRLASNAIQII